MTTAKTEGRYPFPHSWEGEGERLTALARAFDPITRRHLVARRVWRRPRTAAQSPGRRAGAEAVERRLEGLDRLLADPEFVYLAPTLVSAWGRRPPTP